MQGPKCYNMEIDVGVKSDNRNGVMTRNELIQLKGLL